MYIFLLKRIFFEEMEIVYFYTHWKFHFKINFRINQKHLWRQKVSFENILLQLILVIKQLILVAHLAMNKMLFPRTGYVKKIKL